MRCSPDRMLVLSMSVGLGGLTLATLGCGQNSDSKKSGTSLETPRYTQLVGSGRGTCGLKDDHTLQCWGMHPPVPSGEFTRVGWRAHLCGLSRTGELICAKDTRNDPFDYFPGEPLSDFEEGSFHGCGLRVADGSLVCWWESDEFALSAPAGNFVEVVSGVTFSCARTKTGEVTCFGSDAPTPTTRSGFRDIEAGMSHMCGIRHDETIACWGLDVEEVVSNVPSGTFASLSCGNWHCCAIRTDGTLACWGDRADGRSTPPAGRYSVVLASIEHSCAVGDSGTVCWGKNHLGQCDVPQGAGGHSRR